uniref:Uncharacterized protein n=1 Tax=Hucho hucho TaxID=62062 RepID=A0A4W5KT74_9TELE
MWLVATFTLQAIGTSVTIKIPKSNLNLTQTREYLFIDPVGLMFLLGFASLLLIQFFAMFYHRIYTLIHFVAFVNTESKTERRQSDDDIQIPEMLEDDKYFNTFLSIENPAAIQQHSQETRV